jgi:formate hydrogenlyase subunit 6/NADH:ubiquinone oxidoreductase subunit I
MANYIKNMWDGVYTVLVGMKITWAHLFVKKVTVQYPDEQYPIPDNARNRLQLIPDQCNGCNSCARACPVNCITVETLRVVPGDPENPKVLEDPENDHWLPRKLWVPRYDIDMAKCCFCSLCTTVCPSNAIQHTTDFEYSSYDRDDLIFKFSDMTPEKIADKKKMLEDHQAKEKAAKAAAAAKAAEEQAKQASAN